MQMDTDGGITAEDAENAEGDLASPIWSFCGVFV